MHAATVSKQPIEPFRNSRVNRFETAHHARARIGIDERLSVSKRLIEHAPPGFRFETAYPVVARAALLRFETARNGSKRPLSRAMSKRTLELSVPLNDTGKALFVRDAEGELITVLPGQPLPAKAIAVSEAAKEKVAQADAAYEEKRRKELTPEEMQYEAYLASKQNKGGNVWIPNVGTASSDRAAFVDSLAAEVAEHRDSSGKQYAPSRAFDRKRAFKRQGASTVSGFLGGTSVEAARAGAAAASQAMARALEASDDDDDGSLSMNAVQLANRAMEIYNIPISSFAQVRARSSRHNGSAHISILTLPTTILRPTRTATIFASPSFSASCASSSSASLKISVLRRPR